MITCHCPETISDIKVTAATEWTEEMESSLSGGNTIEVAYKIGILPKEDFSEWAAIMGIGFRMEVTKENGPIIHFDIEEHYLWFKIKYG